MHASTGPSISLRRATHEFGVRGRAGVGADLFFHALFLCVHAPEAGLLLCMDVQKANSWRVVPRSAASRRLPAAPRFRRDRVAVERCGPRKSTPAGPARSTGRSAAQRRKPEYRMGTTAKVPVVRLIDRAKVRNRPSGRQVCLNRRAAPRGQRKQRSAARHANGANPREFESKKHGCSRPSIRIRGHSDSDAPPGPGAPPSRVPQAQDGSDTHPPPPQPAENPHPPRVENHQL